MKPKLSYNDQIKHLKHKGVKFDTVSESDAILYLQKNNNFFKLSAYRKNFAKSDKTGKYVNLDFGQLVDLAVIDTLIRMIIIEAALNIEHFAKVKLLKKITNTASEDGYSVVSDYYSSLSPVQNVHLDDEIQRNKNSIYVCELYTKYQNAMPVWAFIEMLSFGSFISFYKFCANRFNDKDLLNDVYLFLSVRKIRNAAAHNSCLINDLSIKTNQYPVDYGLSRELSRIGVKYSKRRRKMACERTAQIITCLYTHKCIAGSTGSHRHLARRLVELKNRLFLKFDYILTPNILTTFNLIIKIIDNWYSIA